MTGKKFFTNIGLLLLIIGFFGFFLTLNVPVTGRVGRFYDQMHMPRINGMAVDSAGNIFVGAGGHLGAIQVFDNTGIFLYRFTFPPGGGAYFTFYIDDDDIVHVAVARGSRYMAFKDGYLVGERRPLETGELEEIRRRRRGSRVDNEGNIYALRGMRVRMYDENRNFIRTISFNTPLRLLLPNMMGFLFFMGIVIMVVANKSFVIEILKSIKDLIDEAMKDGR
ncbi:MAG: hypothetical protein FWB96_07470 [Defluviitaleaceae bacterium]|nr:hypothetical protein [Defluviitaleaceae bacterium]MCL2262646.1 hypothetical protein [Defluviitaleaceae bacterium]